MTPRPNPDLAAALRKMGCPYAPTDSRCPVWIEGYRAGAKEGFEKSAEIVGVKLEVK